MADRQPTRKTVEDLASSAHVRQESAAREKAAQPLPGSQASSQKPIEQVPAGTVNTDLVHPDLILADEDTVAGDLLLSAEVDTQTISVNDPLASLDLSEELAVIEAAGSHVPSGKVVVASAVSGEAGGGAKADKQTAAAGKPTSGEGTTTEDRRPRKSMRERLLMRSVPSWLISMMLHVAMLMTLAAIQLEPVREAIGVLMTANAGEDVGTTLDEEFEIRGPELESPAAAAEVDQTLSTPSEFASQELALPESTSLASATDMRIDVGSIGNVVESILPSSALNASSARMSASLSGRLSGAMKGEMLERFGGNAASEKSVAMALKWLADHQDRSGGWTFGHSHICRGQCKDDGTLDQATNAATALALLPFLGAGQTHLEGNYKATVHNGLKFLISRMKVTGGEAPMGSWHEREAKGNMYSHGLASIVICEAYAMTRDPDLLQPAQLALNFIVYAQDPRGGGWRYEPKQPGDTSVVGWQLMALKSGAMGNLNVPPETIRKASAFLDSMALNDGAYYAYDQPSADLDRFKATTAIGLLCRMYLGWSKDHPALQEGVKLLNSTGPSVGDMYYSYYATQVLRQYGGPEWTKWNAAMRDGLINAQVKEGHAAGSWFTAGGHNASGGRLYCTAMSAMILEVYYRHMPLYSDKSSDDDFEL